MWSFHFFFKKRETRIHGSRYYFSSHFFFQFCWGIRSVLAFSVSSFGLILSWAPLLAFQVGWIRSDLTAKFSQEFGDVVLEFLQFRFQYRRRYIHKSTSSLFFASPQFQFQSEQFLILFNSETELSRFWNFPILKLSDSDTFCFWHFPVRNLSCFVE